MRHRVSEMDLGEQAPDPFAHPMITSGPEGHAGGAEQKLRVLRQALPVLRARALGYDGLEWFQVTGAGRQLASDPKESGSGWPVRRVHQ